MRPAYQYTTIPYLYLSWGETPSGESPTIHYEWKDFKDWERSTVGTRTPGFSKYRSHGSKLRLPINGYSMTETRRSGTLYGAQYMSTIDGHTLGGSYTSCKELFPAYAPFALFSDASILDEANNKAVLRLNDRLSSVKVNYAQFFAERKQTAKLLEDTAFRIVQAASSLKKGDLANFMRSLSLSATQRARVARGWKHVLKDPPSKRVANHWLEYQYGWKPLLSDVFGTAELLARNAATPRKPHGKIKVSAKIAKSLTIPHSLSGLPHFSIELRGSLSGSVTLLCEYTLDDEASAALAETGISNPALLAWELLPYSFVVDWFIPVGTYLGTLTAQDGFKLSAYCTSTFRRCETTMDVSFYKGSQHPPSYETLALNGTFKQRDVSLERVKTLPAYTLQVKSPLGGDPLQRVMTAISLLRQLFR